MNSEQMVSCFLCDSASLRDSLPKKDAEVSKNALFFWLDQRIQRRFIPKTAPPGKSNRAEKGWEKSSKRGKREAVAIIDT